MVIGWYENLHTLSPRGTWLDTTGLGEKQASNHMLAKTFQSIGMWLDVSPQPHGPESNFDRSGMTNPHAIDKLILAQWIYMIK